MAAHSIDLSIIIPVYNEGDNLALLFSNIESLKIKEAEVIFVDGGSKDNSIELIHAFINRSTIPMRVFSCAPGRAAQQNFGARAAVGRTLLFLHADTRLPENAVDKLIGLGGDDQLWGRFNVKLDSKNAPFRVIEWFINQRSKLTGIATGDQGIFVSKTLFTQSGGFPNQLLMEDIELSKRLKKHSRPICLKDLVTTSARRWLSNGIIKTVLLMWKLRAAYYFGAKPESLHRRYYNKH